MTNGSPRQAHALLPHVAPGIDKHSFLIPPLNLLDAVCQCHPHHLCLTEKEMGEGGW